MFKSKKSSLMSGKILKANLKKNVKSKRPFEIKKSIIW